MAYEAIDLFISSSIFLITFTIGLSLRLEDFKKIFKHPKKLTIGLITQLIILPAMAFLIILPTDLLPELKVGIMILAACPGGSITNFISYLIKGDVALSVSLTSVNTFITFLSIPLITNFALRYFLGNGASVTLPLGETITLLFLTIILPCILGIAIRNYNENKAKSVEKVLKYVSIIFLAIVFGVKFFAGQDAGGSGITVDQIFNVFPVLIIISTLALFVGFFISRFFKINKNSAITTGIEVGSQNTALALLIGGTILGSDLMTIPALVYSMFSFYTTLLFGMVMKVMLLPGSLRKKVHVYDPL